VRAQVNAMTQNIYDDEGFFQGCSRPPFLLIAAVWR
jgi:hypothetical protein